MLSRLIPALHISMLALLLLVGGFSFSAQAQMLPGSSAPAAEGVTLPDPLTQEAVVEMVARMSDDQVRGMLLDRLDAVAQSKANTGTSESLFTRITTVATALSTSFSNVFRNFPNLVSEQSKAFSTFVAKFPGNGMWTLFGLIALVLAIGYAAERATGFLTRRWKIPTEPQEDADLGSTVRFLFRRFLREMLGLIVFYVVLLSFGRNLLTAGQLAFAGPFVSYLIWTPRLTAAVSRFVLSPKRSDLRLVNVDDHWAKYLHRNLIGLFLLIGFTIFIVGFNANNGVPPGETRLGFWLNSAVHIYVAIIAWTAREGLTSIMRGTDPDRTRFDEWVAHAYPYFAIGVSATMWLVVELIVATKNRELLGLLTQGVHYTTMFWLLVAPALDTVIRGMVRHLAPPMIGDGPIAEGAYKSTKRGYIRIGRVIVGALVVLMIAGTWDIDLRNLAAAGIGSNLAGNLIEFLMISAVGYIIYEAVSLWINRRLAKEQTATDGNVEEAGGDGGGAGGSRLATVLPLVRMTAQVAIGVIFGLVALSALGIDTTPLLAGAGILGLAIGFGAQKLVTDIVSGIFFLIDDAFRVGEYVDVGGTMGTVEKISIRSMQLRHHRGLVHTIPYGEIPKLTNFSRDWVIMKLKFTVPFDTNPNQVKKIFKKIGAEMMEDPLHKDGFIEPFKSQGVFDFDDVGMVIRGKFMAKPGTQFTIRKEIYNRVKSEFEAADIPFARREVRVAIPSLENHDHLTDEEKTEITTAAAGAAAAAVQQQIEAAETKP